MTDLDGLRRQAYRKGVSADPEVTARIDHLLRTDPRLRAAAPLIGRIPAIVTEPKPERKPRKRRAGKRPPPRVDLSVAEASETTTVTFHASDRATLQDAADALRAAAEDIDLDEPRGDDEEGEETIVPTGLPPWLKVARAKTVSPQMRAALGAEALAYIAIDGGLWGRLSGDLQDRALVLAIRPLVWSERKADGGDVVRRTQPPLQCHADTAEDLSELVAALTDDPEEAATGARAAESLSLLGLPGSEVVHDEGSEPEEGDPSLEDAAHDLVRSRWPSDAIAYRRLEDGTLQPYMKPIRLVALDDDVGVEVLEECINCGAPVEGAHGPCGEEDSE